MLMVYNANFDKTALSLTKKGTSIFRVYYANIFVYDEYGSQLVYVKVPWY